VNVAVGGAAVAGEAVVVEIPERDIVSLKPGARDPVHVIAPAVLTAVAVR
jgi:hypothetical protein